MKENRAIMVPTLAASEVVGVTTCDAPGDDKVSPMTTHDFCVENISKKGFHANFIMQMSCSKAFISMI